MRAFTPIELPNLPLKNRLAMAPLTTYSSHEDGRIRTTELEYLYRRAAAGYGMVMTAACYVHKSGHAFPGQWRCDRDDVLPSLEDGARAIQMGGAAAVLQIHHGGRQAPTALCGGPVCPSAVPSERPGAETPRALEHEEIETIIQAFATAAGRAKRAGFDGVEIHGANTYLLQQFVSPHSNRRTDCWGPDRLKFPIDVVDAVLAEVGPNFAVGYRFSPEEPTDPGIRIGDTLALIEALCSRPLSWLHLSSLDFRASSIVGDYDEPTLTVVCRAIAGRVPLIGVGSVLRLGDAEEMLDMGADMAAIGRLAITEPEWPAVALAGGEPWLRYPATGAQDLLTVPEGLDRRILSVPGWFMVEEALAPALAEPVSR